CQEWIDRPGGDETITVYLVNSAAQRIRHEQVAPCIESQPIDHSSERKRGNQRRGSVTGDAPDTAGAWDVVERGIHVAGCVDGESCQAASWKRNWTRAEHRQRGLPTIRRNLP